MRSDARAGKAKSSSMIKQTEGFIIPLKLNPECQMQGGAARGTAPGL